MQAATYWRSTLALCLGSFVVFSNLYTTQPLLPQFQQAFSISSLEANTSLAVATLALGFSLLVYGPLSDAVGRRVIIFSSLLVSLLATFSLAFAPNFSTLLVLRAVQGFSLGGLPAVALAYMAEEFSKPALAKAVGIYIGANSLGGISGRLVAGFTADALGWQASFLASGVLSLVCILLVLKLLPASTNFQPKPLKIKPLITSLTGHLVNPLLLVAFLISGFNFFIFINQYSYVTFLLAADPWQLSSSWLGMLFLTYLAGTWSASMSGKLALKLAQPRIMQLGIVILMLGSGLMLIPSLWAILAGLLVNSFGFFLAHSTATSWVGRKAETARASASALYLVFYYTGASTGSFYLDPFWQKWGWQGVIYASWLIFGLTLALAVYLYKQDSQVLGASE